MISSEGVKAVIDFEKWASKSWETIKDQCLDKSQLENTLDSEANSKDGPGLLKSLVKNRDILDYYLYRKAVRFIFPDGAYTLVAEVNGIIDKETNKFTTEWYEFIVAKENLPFVSANKSKCIIRIHAPGSRTITSDIDTSITARLEIVTGLDDVRGEISEEVREKSIKEASENFLEDCSKEIRDQIRNHGPDFAGRISNTVIDRFYLFSEETCYMTSSTHRDSNAYLDLVDNEIDILEYPKFSNSNPEKMSMDALKNHPRNPLLGQERLFPNDKEFFEIFNKYKLEKHRLELSASLFSLGLALIKAEKAEHSTSTPGSSDVEHKEIKEVRELSELKNWEDFKKSITSGIKVVADEFLRDGSPEGETMALEYLKKTTNDLNEVFKGTEDFYKNYRSELNKKKQEASILDFLKKSTLKNDIERQRETEIAALNRLYITYLESMTTINGTLLEQQSKNKSLLKKLNSFVKDLENEIAKRKVHEAHPELFRKELEVSSKEIAQCNSKIDFLKKELRENIIGISKLQIEKLKVRYQAHTFANEAYVCRSAVYHVVRGMQQKLETPLSDHTILSSALQQIGFKILHSLEIFDSTHRLERALYRTSKYGFRVHHLLFQKPISQEQLKHLRKPVAASFDILNRLKTHNKQLYRHFKEEELQVLIADKKIIQDLKAAQIPEFDKETGTLKYFGKVDVKKLREQYLSIASKLIALTYFSRYSRKRSLWGESKPLLFTLSSDKESPAKKALPLISAVQSKKTSLTEEKEKHDSHETVNELDITQGQFGSLGVEQEGERNSVDAQRVKVPGDAKFKMGSRSNP